MYTHAFVGPVIMPGNAGAVVATVSDLSALLPQPDIAFTFTDEAIYPALKVINILVVPCPLISVVFAGNVHVYDNALATGTIE